MKAINDYDDSYLMSVEEVAKVLQMSADTLSVWRSTGRYNLPYTKIGRCVKYVAKDVKDFIERRRVV